ncbi:hypothetical protein HBI51_200580 [Parastagonospora nodorum]|nr:hypothetical protein HBI51_200580 [Parastagonospora nodorum]
MSQINVREGYRIITLEVIKLIENLISYLAVAKYIQLRNAQIPKVFYKAASLSIVSNRSTALITNKFSVALLTKLAILNNANITLVDAVHYSIQKLEENYFKVIDALIITLIKDDDDLLGTVNSYIKLRRLRVRYKTKAADSRHAKVSRRRTKKDKDLEDSNTSSDQLEKKAQLKKTRDKEELAKLDSLLDSDDYCLDSSLDINPKNNLEDEEATTAKNLAREQKKKLKALLNAKIRDSLSARVETAIEHCTLEEIFANAISISKTQAIIEVQNAQAEGNAIEHNAVNNNDKLYPTKGERTFYCANSLLENISRLTKEKVIEMQINTTNAISKALAAANKLIILEANTPAVHSKATKHYLALLAAQFIIVYSFRKVDKHIFRAYNTISVTAQRTIIRKGSSYIEKKAILLPNILEKEGLNKLEASRRVIFNCFKMQAIASYSTLATLKAAQFKTYSSYKVKRFTLNSVKDLFTNLSKDYFLVQEARAITKSSLKFQNLLNLCSKIIVALIAFAEAITLTEATHVVIIKPQDSIVYFNLDSKLELKVLSKQDVKTTS